MQRLFIYRDIKKGAYEDITEDTLRDKTQKREFFLLLFL